MHLNLKGICSIFRRIISNEKKEDLIATYRKRGVKIGENTSIYVTYIDWNFGFLIEIGNNCIITGSTILAHDASPKILGKRDMKFGKVRILDNCYIGMNTTILPGNTIGPKSIVGAGSVVTHDVPPNTVVAGNPAKKLCTIDEYKEKLKNKKILKCHDIVPEEVEIKKVIQKVKKMNARGFFDE